MSYNSPPFGYMGRSLGRAGMKVEMLGAGREDTVFSVDGRKIDVPTETLSYDHANPDDITLCFYPNQSKDRATNQNIDDRVRTAIIEYIKTEFAEGKVKFEIDMAG